MDLKEILNCEELPREERCTRCNAPFEDHHHKHITRKGIYHTRCYKERKEVEKISKKIIKDYGPCLKALAEYDKQ